MIYVLITLVLALAIQTVSKRTLRRQRNAAIKLNTELLEINEDQRKALEGSRMMHKVRDRVEERKNADDFWPEIFDYKVG